MQTYPKNANLDTEVRFKLKLEINPIRVLSTALYSKEESNKIGSIRHCNWI
ncbi:hypothetical protein [Coleofasciculus sp. G2-EDA-02]|uniref:hypothetical protein n=1 Tax=Coleofasciculus sp. G2-EDA-02 TaxID=3069529 RepID=UPI0032F89E67